ncbi:hypothetical protein Tco_1068766 [Tanacetum coccineum]|uniref:Uncharacterized protein n=1 Tax=Tanacetum coccineum TaxID=301880 RepID=A0ABQ5HHN6_9ASTR
MLGESSTHTATIRPTKETPYIEGEKDNMITKEAVKKEPLKDLEVENVETEHVQEAHDTKPIPIIIVRKTTKPTLKVELVGSSSQPTGPVIDVTPHEQPESPQAALKAGRGKGIARDIDESPRKLVKASIEVLLDPNTPVLIPFEINDKLYQLTNAEIRAHLEMEKRKQKALQEAKLLEISKHELIKVIHEEATKAEVDPKALSSKKGG